MYNRIHPESSRVAVPQVLAGSNGYRHKNSFRGRCGYRLISALFIALILCVSPTVASGKAADAHRKGFTWGGDGAITPLASYHYSYEAVECGPVQTCYLFGVPFPCKDCWNKGTVLESVREFSIGLMVGWGIDNRNVVGLEFLVAAPLVDHSETQSARSTILGLTWWRYLSNRPNSLFIQVGLGYLTSDVGYVRWSGITVRTGIGYQFTAQVQLFLDYTRTLKRHSGDVSGDGMLRTGMRWLKH